MLNPPHKDKVESDGQGSQLERCRVHFGLESPQKQQNECPECPTSILKGRMRSNKMSVHPTSILKVGVILRDKWGGGTCIFLKQLFDHEEDGQTAKICGGQTVHACGKP